MPSDLSIEKTEHSTIYRWTKNGNLHNEEGPAIICLDRFNRPIDKSWYFDGAPYRDSKPQQVIYDYKEGVIYLCYTHSTNRDPSLPQIVGFNNRKRYSESWSIQTSLHRENDEPALIYYHEDGEISFEGYFILGQAHRINGPAKIHYYKSALSEFRHPSLKVYCLYGQNHNLHGPAIIEYNFYGDIDRQEFWLYHKEVPDFSHVKNYSSAIDYINQYPDYAHVIGYLDDAKIISLSKEEKENLLLL